MAPCHGRFEDTLPCAGVPTKELQPENSGQHARSKQEHFSSMDPMQDACTLQKVSSCELAADMPTLVLCSLQQRFAYQQGSLAQTLIGVRPKHESKTYNHRSVHAKPWTLTSAWHDSWHHMTQQVGRKEVKHTNMLQDRS